MHCRRIVNWLTEFSTRSWFEYFLLFLITLAAAGLRFYQLGEWSFWIDEIFTINHAMAHFSNRELLLANIPPSRNWLPVSLIFTAQALNAWGVNEWSARLTSTILGILTIPILYLPAKRIFGSRVALLAVLLLAMAPWHIFWSQNARFYSALMLFYSLALFAFHFGIEQDQPKYLFLFVILVYLAASERLTALFIFPVVALYLASLWLLKFEKPRGVNTRNLAIVAVPVLIGGIVEVYSRIANGESRFFADLTWFTQYKIDDPFRLLVFAGNNLGIPLVVMAVFSGTVFIFKKSRPGLLLFVSGAVPLLSLILLNLVVFTKDRYLFLSLFSWIILAVSGIIEISSRLDSNRMWWTLGLLSVLFAQTANDTLLYYQANHGNRLQWKSAFTLIKEQADESDIVVVFWPEIGQYYLGRSIVPYTGLELREILEDDRRYWFVLDSETIWLNPEIKSWIENNAELIEVWYLRMPENNFLRVYFYDSTEAQVP